MTTTAQIENMTVKQLVKFCKENKIAGYSAALRLGGKAKARLQAFIRKYMELDDVSEAGGVAVEVPMSEEAGGGDDVEDGDAVEGPMPMVSEAGDVTVPDQDEDEDERVEVGLRLGDNVEIAGYAIDGDRAVVIGFDAEDVQIATEQGPIYTLPAWALTKIECPPPALLTYQQGNLIYFILREAVIQHWMAHCTAEIKDGLPVFSFERHHSLQLISDAAKESPFIYMGLFWDGDKAGWIGLWLSEKKSLYFSGDIQQARQIFEQIKALFWDFNSLEDVSLPALESYKNFKFQSTNFLQLDNGITIFEFEDDQTNFLDGTSLVSKSVDSLVELFSDDKKDEFWLGMTFNGKAYCCTGTEDKIRPLYKSLFNLYAIAEC